MRKSAVLRCGQGERDGNPILVAKSSFEELNLIFKILAVKEIQIFLNLTIFRPTRS